MNIISRLSTFFTYYFYNWGVRSSDSLSFKMRMRVMNLLLAIMILVVHPLIGLYHTIYSPIHLYAFFINTPILALTYFLHRKRKITHSIIILNLGFSVSFAFSVFVSEAQYGGIFGLLSLGVITYYIVDNPIGRNLMALLNFITFYALLYYQPNYLTFESAEFIIIGVALLFLFFSLLFFSKQIDSNEKVIQVQQEQLQQKNEELSMQTEELKALDEAKTHFFNNTSHEFRTPLTLLLGIIQQLQEEAPNAKTEDLLAVAKKQGSSLKLMIDQILDIAKLDKQQERLHLSNRDIIPFLRGFTMAFESMATGKNIDLHFHTMLKSLHLPFDQEILMKVINNLVSNAIKFSEQGGKISVTAELIQDKLLIKVQDTGIGISASDLPLVFDRFYQTDHMRGGTGIGLALVKELLEFHKGGIGVESQKGAGSTFHFWLPLSKAVYELHDFSSGEQDDSPNIERFIGQHNVTLATASTETITQSEEKPLILLVEDNPDLHYLISVYLENDYSLIHAENGQEGIEQALQHSPDLIVSDVVMPKKSGYELCSELKNDERSSHIPIILLSAKSEQQDKLIGLETQADDYLTKPFDKQELLIRIHNLIETRRQLRELYEQATQFVPKKITRNPKDQAFLDRALEVLEKCYSDSQFSVQHFSELMNLSIRHLNRKLQALINQSSTKFIQSFRLQKAIELLDSTEKQVSEISIEIGFNSPTYFIRCFKEKFGKTPKEYQEKIN